MNLHTVQGAHWAHRVPEDILFLSFQWQREYPHRELPLCYNTSEGEVYYRSDHTGTWRPFRENRETWARQGRDHFGGSDIRGWALTHPRDFKPVEVVE